MRTVFLESSQARKNGREEFRTKILDQPGYRCFALHFLPKSQKTWFLRKINSRVLDLFLSTNHEQTIFDNGLASQTCWKPPGLQKTVGKNLEPIFSTSQHIVVFPFIFSQPVKIPQNMVFEKNWRVERLICLFGHDELRGLLEAPWNQKKNGQEEFRTHILDQPAYCCFVLHFLPTPQNPPKSVVLKKNEE